MRKRILVFDDDENIRSLLWQILDKRGYEVFTFPEPGLCPLHIKDNCDCSLEQACGDIILSDVDMPNISGLKFIESLFNKGCKVKNVGLMSGAWSEADLKIAQKLGCHVLHKPFTIDGLNKWLDYCEGRIDPKRELSNGWLKSKSPQSG